MFTDSYVAASALAVRPKRSPPLDEEKNVAGRGRPLLMSL